MRGFSSDRSPLSVVDREIRSRGIEMSSSQEPIPPSRVRETSSLEKTLNIMQIRIPMVRLFGVIDLDYGIILISDEDS